MLERLSQRGRVIALFLAHTGIRSDVLGSYGGEAGLRLIDLPELEFAPHIRFEETPFAVRVAAELSKTRRQYITLGTEQLATALTAYLNARKESGELLDELSPVVVPGTLRGVAVRSREQARFGRGFIAMKNVVKEVQDALHTSAPQGVRWRPYVLRSYCSTRLLLAEGQGRISRDLREAILGHDGGVASRYNVGKRWGAELLAEARREYANAAEFLETNTQTRTNIAAEFRRTLLAVAGLPEEQAAEHVNDSNEELLTILRDKLIGRDAALPSPLDGTENGHGNGHGIQETILARRSGRFPHPGVDLHCELRAESRAAPVPPVEWLKALPRCAKLNQGPSLGRSRSHTVSFTKYSSPSISSGSLKVSC